jgi:hypothetical protein
MFKSICLGIACLTLGISGVTRATEINVDGGKYGDDKCIKTPTDCKFDLKCVDFKPVCDDKIVIDPKLDCDKTPGLGNLLCDLKLKLDCHPTILDNKDGKDGCKVDFCDDKHEPKLCDLFCDKDSKGHDHCDLTIDPCGYDHNDHCCQPPCDPDPAAAVPAPASAAFGGLGVAGIMLMAGLKARRATVS